MVGNGLERAIVTQVEVGDEGGKGARGFAGCAGKGRLRVED